MATELCTIERGTAMANITDGFRDIFLAGVGALSVGGEKAKEVLDDLIERGQISVEEGRKINEELKHRATGATSQVRDETIRAYVNSLSAEDREVFLNRVSAIVDEADANDAKKAKEQEDEAIEAEVIDIEEEIAEAAEKIVEDAETIAE